MEKPIYVLGDVHGVFDVISRWMSKYDIRDASVIQVGDFGVGFEDDEEDRLYKLNKKLHDRNVVLYVIRGNHDDPSRFYSDGKIFDADTSNIFLLQDYSLLALDGIKILLVGGAISIDRKGRTTGISYWPDELFFLDVEKLKAFTNVDFVVTHTAPDFCKHVEWGRIVYDWADIDPGLHHELQQERRDLTQMYEILKKKNQIKKWYYGHFHDSGLTEMDGTDFVLLNINEFKELKYET